MKQVMSSITTYSVSSDWKWHTSVSKDATVYTAGGGVAIISGATIHLFGIYYSSWFSGTFRLSKPDPLMLP